MWAVIGVSQIDPALIDEIRALTPAMAEGNVGMPGYLHGTQAQDKHALLVVADELSVRPDHGDVIAQGAVERPGLHSKVWDVAEVASTSPQA